MKREIKRRPDGIYEMTEKLGDKIIIQYRIEMTGGLLGTWLNLSLDMCEEVFNDLSSEVKDIIINLMRQIIEITRFASPTMKGEE